MFPRVLPDYSVWNSLDFQRFSPQHSNIVGNSNYIYFFLFLVIKRHFTGRNFIRFVFGSSSSYFHFLYSHSWTLSWRPWEGMLRGFLFALTTDPSGNKLFNNHSKIIPGDFLTKCTLIVKNGLIVLIVFWFFFLLFFRAFISNFPFWRERCRFHRGQKG